MGFIDEDLIAGAIEYTRTRKKNAWMKWAAMAACLCISFVGIIQLILSKSEVNFGADMTVYELTMVEDTLFFVDPKGGVYYFESDLSAPEKLGDFQGTLTKTAGGLYCTDYINNVVYKVVDKELQKLIEISTKENRAWFIDSVGDYVYWCTVNSNDGDDISDVRTYRTNTSTGDVQFLFSDDTSIHKPQHISNEYIYYQTLNNEIKAYNMISNKIICVNDTFSQSKFDIRDISYYQDCMVIDVDETLSSTVGTSPHIQRCLFRMSYNGKDVVKLTDIVPDVFSPVRVDDTLYYSALYKTETGSHISFVSCDIKNGDVIEITEYPTELSSNASEMAVSVKGIYITNPSFSEGGIFFYDCTTGSIKRIYK